jgi:type I restriction enzyme R subunit
VGQRYLIQHSAGSGKSNSIAWLAHQLVTLQHEGKTTFDSVIVVTDRVNLDKQIKNTIRKFMQVQSTVGWATKSGDLRDLLKEGKKIIVTIVHKFQYILEDIGAFHQGQHFAIIIDEAHSSQSGRLSAKMNIALSGTTSDEDDDLEDKINTIIEGKKMVKNASYFAFTATPKNKTLEMFGVPYHEGDQLKHRPYHVYTMKQAIEEGFILDVLRNYMPIQSYYRITKTVENDPMFDRKRAQKKLRLFVESNEYAIKQKAEIIVEHFHTDVISKGKVGGKARAMVVTSSIQRASSISMPSVNASKHGRVHTKQSLHIPERRMWAGSPLRSRTSTVSQAPRLKRSSKLTPIAFLWLRTSSRRALTSLCSTQCMWIRYCRI